jgi:hypothetical protein
MTECKCDPSEGLICAACAAGTTDWKTRAEAAEARAHELSVKYVCALRRAREMEEALKAGLTDFENHTDSHPQWVLNHYHRARAALASQKTIGEPDEA